MARYIGLFTVIILMTCPWASAADEATEVSLEKLVERSYWAIDRIEKTHREIKEVLRAKPRPDDFEEQLGALRTKTREARSEIDKLIAEIKIGKSVFFYPGLLGLGFTVYVGSNDTEKDLRGTYYLKILIGYSDRSGGGSEPRFYEIHFSGEGLILDHRLVPRMLE